jgi:hypothetical protein
MPTHAVGHEKQFEFRIDEKGVFVVVALSADVREPRGD